MAGKKKAAPSQRALNNSGLGVIDDREAGLDQLDANIKEKRNTYSLSPSDVQKLNKLEEQEKAARNTLDQEKKLRQDIEAAYSKSTYKDPDADPDVKAAWKALNNHKKAAAKGLYSSKDAVAKPCTPCMQKQLDKVKDCAKPFWTTANIKMPNGSTVHYEGPTYPVCHQHTLKNYENWDDLIANKQKTESEKNIISTMSVNEGDLDTVQGWDSQVASLGAMQKTINPQGEGELPKQILEFKESNPEAYKRLFEDKGWTVRQDEIPPKKKGGKTTLSKPRMYWKDPDDSGAEEMRGADLKSYLDDPKDPAKWKKIMGPLRDAGADPDFQKKQVCDFNARLVSAVNVTPNGYTGTIQDYVTSEKSAAYVLDQSVNAPALVSRDFGKALKTFYAANPKASKEPSGWTAAERAKYEKQITANYAAERKLVDKASRDKMIAGSNLSTDPGSLKWPEKEGCGNAP
jgi:hypothetical protein